MNAAGGALLRAEWSVGNFGILMILVAKPCLSTRWVTASQTLKEPLGRICVSMMHFEFRTEKKNDTARAFPAGTNCLTFAPGNSPG